MTNPTYAEAVKWAAEWASVWAESNGEMDEGATEALAVLRRAGKVMEAVEEADLYGATGMSVSFTSSHSLTVMNANDLLRACAEYRKGEK